MIRSYRISANASAFQAGGALREGALYVTRDADDEIVEALLAKQSCYVLAPPETGKSSLRLGTQRRLKEMSERAPRGAGAPLFHCIDIDLAAVGAAATENDWFFTLAYEIASRTNLEAELDALWDEQDRATPAHRWRQFLVETVLPQVAGPGADRILVLFFDEAHAVLDLPFLGNSFFRMVRSLSESEVRDRLRFCVFGSMAPDALVDNRDQTPFTEGRNRQIELVDFGGAEAQAFAAPLASVFGSESAEALLREILSWTSGHPYMTQRLCHELERDRRTTYESAGERVESVVRAVFLDRGPFEDAPLLFAERYLSKEHPSIPLGAMLHLYGQILDGRRIVSKRSNSAERHLRLAGLVASREERGDLVLRPRNRIFEQIFDAEWLKEKKSEVLLRTQTRQWQDAEASRKNEMLLRDKPLRHIVAWSRTRHALEPQEDAFLQESLDVALAAEETKRWRHVSVGLLVAVTLLSAVGIYASWKRREAEESSRMANLALRSAERLNEAEISARLAVSIELGNRMGTTDTQRSRAAVEHGFKLMLELAGAPEDVTLIPALRLFAVAQNEFWDTKVLAPDPSNGDGTVFGAAFSPEGTRAALAGPGNAASLWDAAAGVRIASLGGHHTAPVREIAFSRDGALIVTVSDDGTSALWDGRTGQLRGALEKQAKAVTTAAFSPASDLLVTAGDDGVARLWDATTGHLVRAVEAHDGPVHRVRFSADGARFAVAAADGIARIWGIDGRKTATLGSGAAGAARRGHAGAVYDIAFSPDGARVVTAGADGTARLWNVKTGQQLATMRGNGKFVYTVAFSPDGERVATGGENDVVLLWNAGDGTLASSLKIDSGGLNRVSFSPDGQTLATASADQHLRLWNVQSATLTTDLVGHRGAVTDVVFSKNGDRILTSAIDGTARVWTPGVAGGPPVTLVGPTALVRSLSYSNDGRRIAAASDDGVVHVWEASGKLLAALRGPATSAQKVLFLRDGARLVTAGEDGVARIWQVETGTELLRLVHGGAVTDLAISVDGETVVTASKDGTARAWSARSGELLWKLDLGEAVTAVAVSGRGRVSAGSAGGALQIVNLLDGKAIVSTGAARKHTDKIRQISFSPDGTRLVSASNDGTARVWDAGSGELVLLLEGHSHYVIGATFSADGARILTHGWDGTAWVWGAADGKPVAFLADNTKPLRSAVFSPGGEWVATGGLDGVTRLWDVASNKLLGTFGSRVSDVWSLAFSPDGKHLAAAGQDGAVRVYASSKPGLIAAACRFIEQTGQSDDVRAFCAEQRRIDGE